MLQSGAKNLPPGRECERHSFYTSLGLRRCVSERRFFVMGEVGNGIQTIAAVFYKNRMDPLGRVRRRDSGLLFLFDRASLLTLTASLIGVTSLIFNAKGHPAGQALMVVLEGLYHRCGSEASLFLKNPLAQRIAVEGQADGRAVHREGTAVGDGHRPAAGFIRHRAVFKYGVLEKTVSRRAVDTKRARSESDPNP